MTNTPGDFGQSSNRLPISNWNFFGHYFSLDLHLMYYTDAIHTLLHIRLEMSERPLQGYGYNETIGTWPILPQELIETISASQ